MNITNRFLPNSANSSILQLLWVVVFLLFTILPLHSDISFVAIMAALISYFAAKERGYSLRGCVNGEGKAILLAFISYVSIALISCILNPSTLVSSSRLLIWTSCLWVGYVVAQIYPQHGYVFVRGMIAALLVGFLVLLPVGYLQGDVSEYYTAYRLELLTGHPSRLALFAVLGVFYCLYEGIQRRARSVWPWIVWSSVLISIIVLTNTRALMLFLPVAILVYAFLALRRRAWLIASVVLLGVGIVAGIVMVNKDSSSSRRLISLVEDLPSDPTFQSRLPIWEAGWWAFTQSPIVGNGLKSYREMHRVYEKAHSLDWKRKYPGYEKTVKHSHNIVLGRLVETGLLGAIAFLFMYYFVLMRLLRGPKKDYWLASFLIFYLCIGFVDDPLNRVNDSFILFLFGTVAGRPGVSNM